METLVAVLLRRIDIVVYRAWLFAEVVSKHRVDFKAHSLLANIYRVWIDDTDVVLAIDMLYIATLGLGLTPHAVWLSIAHLYTNIVTCIFEYLLNLVRKYLE